MVENKNDLISRIIELECQIISEIFKGYKPSINDHLQPKRIEINMLRCIVFGYDSKFCKK